ncbi:MAG: hypothetical protein HY401_05165 [Elusimicrobia bacterium]|nr:hypothetical protein [Elusimicrobiota bacterium]
MRSGIVVVALLLAAAGTVKFFSDKTAEKMEPGTFPDGKEPGTIFRERLDRNDVLPETVKAGADERAIAKNFDESSLAMTMAPGAEGQKGGGDIDALVRSGKAKVVVPSHLSRDFFPDFPIVQKAVKSKEGKKGKR